MICKYSTSYVIVKYNAFCIRCCDEYEQTEKNYINTCHQKIGRNESIGSYIKVCKLCQS